MSDEHTGSHMPTAHHTFQAVYQQCSDACLQDPVCTEWDWDPTTDLCHRKAGQSTPSPAPSTNGALARPPPTPPPTYDPAMAKLIAKYEAEKNASCATVLPHVPTLDPTDAAAFMAAYRAFVGNNSEAPVIAAAQKLFTPALDAFLSLPDSFTPAGLDASMVKCALMTQAERGSGTGKQQQGHLLAAFAANSSANEALVDQLLNDAVLMRDMLVAGGPGSTRDDGSGHYGEAMAIYTSLVNASSTLRATLATARSRTGNGEPWDDRSPDTVLKRLALGVSLALAVPIEHRYADTMPNASMFVDPIARYLHYERHYLAGDLDPAFAVSHSLPPLPTRTQGTHPHLCQKKNAHAPHVRRYCRGRAHSYFELYRRLRHLH
jgi:hypothetical protein